MKLTILLLLILLLSSCTDTFCGKIDNRHQEMLDKVNLRYKNILKVENIPCEYIYLEVHYEIVEVDTILLNEVHNLLYDENQRTGWQTLLIYDYRGDYIFSHSKNGNIYYQIGD